MSELNLIKISCIKNLTNAINHFMPSNKDWSLWQRGLRSGFDNGYFAVDNILPLKSSLPLLVCNK